LAINQPAIRLGAGEKRAIRNKPAAQLFLVLTMKNRLPRNNDRFQWTSHIKQKMLFYRIPESKIRTILKSPDRREEGVARDTIAIMKRNDKPKRREEIWVMYQTKDTRKKQEKKSLIKAFRKQKYIMISVWRYPGTTKAGERPMIPDDIAERLGLGDAERYRPSVRVPVI